MPRDPGKDPRALLGLYLRRSRLAAGFTSQEALAGQLGFDRSVVAKAETGDRLLTSDVLAAWLSACPALDEEMCVNMIRLSRASNEPVPLWFERWLQAEASAPLLKYWQPIIVPGLFQTPSYARALLLAAQDDISDEALEPLISARISRQNILNRPNPPDIVVVFDEAVLHRLIGSAQIMYDQLMHLAELSTRPNIVLQVVPTGNGANAGLGGAFNLAAGNGYDLVHMDGVEGQTTERADLLSKAVIAYDRVRGDALPQRQSAELLLRVGDQVWKS